MYQARTCMNTLHTAEYKVLHGKRPTKTIFNVNWTGQLLKSRQQNIITLADNLMIAISDSLHAFSVLIYMDIFGNSIVTYSG